MSVYEQIQALEAMKTKMTSSKPIKPAAKYDVRYSVELNNAILKEHELYGEKLKAYKAEYDSIKAQNNIIDNKIYDLIMHESGASRFNEQQKDVIYSRAYQKGHDSGWYGIYNALVDIVDLVKEVLKLQ